MLIATCDVVDVEWNFQEQFYEWTNTTKELEILIHEKSSSWALISLLSPTQALISGVGSIFFFNFNKWLSEFIHHRTTVLTAPQYSSEKIRNWRIILCWNINFIFVLSASCQYIKVLKNPTKRKVEIFNFKCIIVINNRAEADTCTHQQEKHKTIFFFSHSRIFFFLLRSCR